MEGAGGSTGAAVLEHRQPARDAADLYRDRAIDDLEAARIIEMRTPNEVPEIDSDAGEVMQVFKDTVSSNIKM